VNVISQRKKHWRHFSFREISMCGTATNTDTDKFFNHQK
jgi:hypothetical protein